MQRFSDSHLQSTQVSSFSRQTLPSSRGNSPSLDQFSVLITLLRRAEFAKSTSLSPPFHHPNPLSWGLHFNNMSASSDVLDNELTGFGRRTNGTCDSSEKECGPTTRGQHACCPGGMFCLGEDNTVCCPNEDQDCTDALLETPRCAEREWTMYNNSAPFCCSSDAVAAFKTNQDSNICADGGFQPLEGDFTLPVVEQEDDRSKPSDTVDRELAHFHRVSVLFCCCNV